MFYFLFQVVDCLEDIIHLSTAYANLQLCISTSLIDFSVLAEAHSKYLNELNSKKIIWIMKNFLSTSFISSEVST